MGGHFQKVQNKMLKYMVLEKKKKMDEFSKGAEN